MSEANELHLIKSKHEYTTMRLISDIELYMHAALCLFFLVYFLSNILCWIKILRINISWPFKKN